MKIPIGTEISLLQGDCRIILAGMGDDSFDALVTDPPAGIAFMGKDWDKDKGGRAEWVAWMADVMRECLRVLKPGAHALVWAIPRTSHWTATALEDAGFEIRDVVTHLFGTGFPKSADVSKHLDKHEQNHWIGVAKAVDSLDGNAILDAWKIYSETANPAGIRFQKSPIGTGTSTEKSDFAPAFVRLAINPERSSAHAILRRQSLKI